MSDYAIPPASATLVTGFVALAIALAVLAISGVHAALRRTGMESSAARRGAGVAALGLGAWLALGGVAAASGALRFDGGPPTMLAAILVTIGATIALARSTLGRRAAAGLPLAVLVGYQGFRVAVELLLHRAYVEGLMPVQMSYAGRNFDVVTGLGAIGLGAWLATGRAPLRLVALWNWVGLGLLANVVGIAMLSAPTPFRTFHGGPPNVWITRAPWVWLPLLMVPMALLGHLLVFRRLRMERSAHPLSAPLANHPRGLPII